VKIDSVKFTAELEDANVGVNKAVKVSNVSLLGKDSANYKWAISADKRTIEVTQKPISIKVNNSLNNTTAFSQYYGDDLIYFNDNPKNYYTAGLLLSGDVLDVKFVQQLNKNAGSYAVTIDNLLTNIKNKDSIDVTKNYNITITNGTYEIKPRELQIILDSFGVASSKIYYGDAGSINAPQFTWHLFGSAVGEVVQDYQKLANQEEIKDIFNVNCISIQSFINGQINGAKDYVISANAGAITTDSENYNVSVAPATYTISKRLLTVSIDVDAADLSKMTIKYSDNLTLQSQIDNIKAIIKHVYNKEGMGLYASDTFNIDWTLKTDTGVVLTNSSILNAGSYSVVAQTPKIMSGVDDVTNCYEITMAVKNPKFIITPVDIFVLFNQAVCSKIYGDEDPKFELANLKLNNEDGTLFLSQYKLAGTYSIVKEPAKDKDGKIIEGQYVENAGDYNFDISKLKLEDASKNITTNFKINVFAGSKFTIKKRAITLKAKDKTFYAGATDVKFDFIIENKMPKDSISDIFSTLPTLTVDGDINVVGTHTIKISGGKFNNATGAKGMNYELAVDKNNKPIYKTGVATINSKPYDFSRMKLDDSNIKATFPNLVKGITLEDKLYRGVKLFNITPDDGGTLDNPVTIQLALSGLKGKSFSVFKIDAAGVATLINSSVSGENLVFDITENGYYMIASIAGIPLWLIILLGCGGGLLVIGLILLIIILVAKSKKKKKQERKDKWLTPDDEPKDSVYKQTEDGKPDVESMTDISSLLASETEDTSVDDLSKLLGDEDVAESETDNVAETAIAQNEQDDDKKGKKGKKEKKVKEKKEKKSKHSNDTVVDTNNLVGEDVAEDTKADSAAVEDSIEDTTEQAVVEPKNGKKEKKVKEKKAKKGKSSNDTIDDIEEEDSLSNIGNEKNDDDGLLLDLELPKDKK
ncbi:MAG: YDG domain-containing protein, partial [Clostridia bacterium]